MGQEDEKEKRKRDFAPYQVNDELMSAAGDNAIFMVFLNYVLYS